MPPEPRPAGQPGFTLLEVMVATLIAAFAAAVLFRAALTGLTATRLAAAEAAALSLARSHLATLGRTRPLSPGVTSGRDPGGFTWRLRLHPLARSTSPALTLMGVTLTESWHLAGRRHRLRLTTARLATPAPPAL